MKPSEGWVQRKAFWFWFGPEQLPVLFSVVLRALFRKSDPKRFQNIFTTLFTLFTMLTLDDWSLIYMDSRAQGGQRAGSRAWWVGANGSVTPAVCGLLTPARKSRN